MTSEASAPSTEAGYEHAVFAPGRVNLIGDHTDHAGGLALPMAVQLGTTLRYRREGDRVELTSDAEPVPASVPIDVDDPSRVRPSWARYVAGVVAEVRPKVGLRGELRTTLPLGGGLSSSAALEVAVAIALGAPRDPLTVARLCQRAEHRGPQVPCGLMDQLTCTAGVEGAALLIDFTLCTWTPVPLPDTLAVHVVHCGVPRQLDGSAYADRADECKRAADQIGPLAIASLAGVHRLPDSVMRRRARHVVSENMRVRAMVDALRASDLTAAGALLVESHRSLRDDFEVSIPALDDLVERLCATPGVFGARLTGAGFGGCVVAFADAQADLSAFGGWRMHASAGARVIPTQAGS